MITSKILEVLCISYHNPFKSDLTIEKNIERGLWSHFALFLWVCSEYFKYMFHLAQSILKGTQ
jgi:hypothetical protein